ncbi:MAG: hypothetical protein MK100_03545 [Phycisphaerales bacterium]|nr:hypothetical protein [Phycisphaerales bacterium]
MLTAGSPAGHPNAAILMYSMPKTLSQNGLPHGPDGCAAVDVQDQRHAGS